ncbi:hypothetical protein SAMN05444366_2992 [Flavobacterium saccharophilum]|uniref:Uncharacterized protein n=1 Tax=Flavobacterium saccharophilum TaxID=29534 RepID=A0A1M7I3T3_9FLAO|nr:hypothetical protein SAMN05444366_2992 [Flavobacterium saccharophilum]
MKPSALAPIEVEILLWWGSPQKIGTDSGISSLLKLKLKKNARPKLILHFL